MKLSDIVAVSGLLLTIVTFLFNLAWPQISSAINQDEATAGDKARKRCRDEVNKVLYKIVLPIFIAFFVLFYVNLPTAVRIISTSKLDLWNFDVTLTLYVMVVYALAVFVCVNAYLFYKLFKKQFKFSPMTKKTQPKNPISHQEYENLFKKNKDIHEQALKQAYEIRKFEIELYWKRATYFWTFIGATFVGYAAYYNSKANNAQAPDNEFMLLLICSIGVIFSVAWFLVNKGSKFWQENWENHVELLEDEIFGPLYKTLTKRPRGDVAQGVCEKTKAKLDNIFVAPKAYSVSKINQLVSAFVALIWCGLFIKTLLSNLDFDIYRLILVCATIFFCGLFYVLGKSHNGSHNPKISLRKTNVTAPDLET